MTFTLELSMAHLFQNQYHEIKCNHGVLGKDEPLRFQVLQKDYGGVEDSNEVCPHLHFCMQLLWGTLEFTSCKISFCNFFSCNKFCNVLRSHGFIVTHGFEWVRMILLSSIFYFMLSIVNLCNSLLVFNFLMYQDKSYVPL